MRRRLIARGNVHKSDFLRALVTDTLPGDVPIIVSNDGFYKNMRPAALNNSDQRDFIGRLILAPRPYTKPYRYNILRSGGAPRRLSLIHPSGQLAVVDIYKNYGELICYYCRKSEASIRSPRKIGSLFFVRGAESNKNSIRKAGIDTVNIETTVSNPASYYSYSGVDRAFRFFTSTEYVRLEKRYPLMHLADVSKCFSSIYTHTLFWAVADVLTAKDNVAAQSFANSFDRIMQSINYNETNGICVGAEVSRIFAEIILSEVDRRVIFQLKKSGLRFRIDYEFRRYVDDFYLFSKDDAIADQVLSAINACLADFNLHLNDAKTSRIPRPFVSTKSRMVGAADTVLEKFFEKFISSGVMKNNSYSYPIKIRRPQAIMRILLDGIKGACFDNKTGYGAVSNYVIGAIGTRIAALIDGYQYGQLTPNVDREDYVVAISLLLEATYFFYNVDPTVPSSLRVAQAAVLAANFFERSLHDRSPFLVEQIVRWTSQFVRETNGGASYGNRGCIPLEAINLLLVLGVVGRGELLARQAIVEFCERTDELEYFDIVTSLYCLRDDVAYQRLRDRIFERACYLVRGKDRVRVEAQAAHLALDILACPYIAAAKRAKLFNDLRVDVDLPRISLAAASAAVAEFEVKPWFVNWRQLSLLSMIRKKELSSVY